MKISILLLVVLPAFAVAQPSILAEYVDTVTHSDQVDEGGTSFDRFEIKLKKEPLRAYIVIFSSAKMDDDHIEAILDVGLSKGFDPKGDRLKSPMFFLLKKGLAERTKLYLKYSGISYSTASDSLMSLAKNFKITDKDEK